MNTVYIVNLPEIVLKPGNRFSTSEVKVVIPTYDTEFNLELSYILDGQDARKVFEMKRQTAQEMEKKGQ